MAAAVEGDDPEDREGGPAGMPRAPALVQDRGGGGSSGETVDGRQFRQKGETAVPRPAAARGVRQGQIAPALRAPCLLSRFVRAYEG